MSLALPFSSVGVDCANAGAAQMMAMITHADFTSPERMICPPFCGTCAARS
jgi:hypothetical protein